MAGCKWLRNELLRLRRTAHRTTSLTRKQEPCRCVRACVCACMRACAGARACVRVFVRTCVFVHVHVCVCCVQVFVVGVYRRIKRHVCQHQYACMSMHMFIHILLTRLHTCPHTCLPTCLHTCLHTSLPTCFHPYLHVNMSRQACGNACTPRLIFFTYTGRCPADKFVFLVVSS